MCNRPTLLLIVLSIPLLLSVGAGSNQANDKIDPVSSTDGPRQLSDVIYWAYQLQNITDDNAVDALASSRYDMLVLEPTCTDWSSDDRYFDTGAMVDRLKSTPAHDGDHRKLVIAYLDIGEAEDWRWYWTWSTDWDEGDPVPSDWPDFILTHDPDGWEGNYPVAYWDPDWQDIIIYGRNQGTMSGREYTSALDEVIQHGFDGVYLDWVEGFENKAVISRARADGIDPKDAMVEFIRQIRDYGRQYNPDFIVIQQNAGALIDGHPELTDYVDGIAQEGIWLDGDATDDWNDPDGYDWITDPELTGEYVAWLWMYMDAGVTVFICEYALHRADSAYDFAYERGFIPYVTRRSLGRLTTTPPPGM